VNQTSNVQPALENYVVVGSKSWSRQVFDDVISKSPGRWYFVDSQDQLTGEHMQSLSPRFVFFLHWSRKVPNEIVDNYECVCFHMTDVPYGRGGSPLQNLIVRGHRSTILSALRMTDEIDAGPVYLKEELSLEGSAEEIYLRANYLAAQMIDTIIRERPKPATQTGEVVAFKRRRPEESEIQNATSLLTLYDFIRMLDAEGYPRAFITHRGFRHEFSEANLHDGGITAVVTITPARGMYLINHPTVFTLPDYSRNNFKWKLR
jgi:methionyl-tRNA formyltransferase